MTYYTDPTGKQYQTPDGKPAASGVPVQIHTPTGPVPGTMDGTNAVPNKQQ
jgi:hypothetical protein